MKITNLYTPLATSTLMIVKWNSEEDCKEMDIEQDLITYQEDLIPTKIFWLMKEQSAI